MPLATVGKSYSADGTHLCTVDTYDCCIYDGGWGGEQPPRDSVEYPDREPDFTYEETYGYNWPLVYRLMGDWHQQHIDWSYTEQTGLERPIAHGVSSAGVAMRHVISLLFPGHPEAMTRFKCRFTSPVLPGVRLRTIVWAGIGIAVFQQLVGINIVFYYGAVLWQSVGFSENDALLINIVSGAVSILACLATVLLIDRIGRKPLLLIGSIGMAANLAVMALCFANAMMIDGQLSLPGSFGLVALIAANLYVIFFNLSWGPVMWVMLGEMFPNQIRGSALAVSGLAQWAANFAIVLSFPWAAKHLGLPITYGFYAASALISFFFVRAVVRETKGKELEAMQG